MRSLSVIALLTAATAVFSIKVDTKNVNFIDKYGRVRVFHGMNAVYKVAPWHPDVSGFDSDNSLSDIDAVNLNNWGFNIIRLGVMWPGVEPQEQGVFNETYLDQIETIVDNLAAQNVSVILDMHQDLWHRKFCGEGVPDYVYNACLSELSPDTPAFPAPPYEGPYPVDSNGDPDLQTCLGINASFFTYYFAAEVCGSFQCLYDNKANLWDALAGFWRKVAQRFESKESVLGYELINEPWVGDTYHDKSTLLPHVTEVKYLQPMYTHIHSILREVDKEKIIFFEGVTLDYAWETGFTEGPGGPEYNDRQALSYHIYCPPSSVKQLKLCNEVNAVNFNMRLRDRERLGLGMMMTEFGAAEDEALQLQDLEQLCTLVDTQAQSWMYWQFKYYHDITTMTPEGESLYSRGGEPSLRKLRVLSRTYPYAVAGAVSGFSFDTHSAVFEMTFTALSTLPSDPIAATTDVYFNRQLFYPRGVSVVISGEGAPQFQVQCAGNNHVYLVQQGPASAAVTVVLSPCESAVACSCS